jgi:hypothetical protein
MHWVLWTNDQRGIILKLELACMRLNHNRPLYRHFCAVDISSISMACLSVSSVCTAFQYLQPPGVVDCAFIP